MNLLHDEEFYMNLIAQLRESREKKQNEKQSNELSLNTLDDLLIKLELEVNEQNKSIVIDAVNKSGTILKKYFELTYNIDTERVHTKQEIANAIGFGIVALSKTEENGLIRLKNYISKGLQTNKESLRQSMSSLREATFQDRTIPISILGIKTMIENYEIERTILEIKIKVRGGHKIFVGKVFSTYPEMFRFIHKDQRGNLVYKSFSYSSFLNDELYKIEEYTKN